MCVVGYFIFIWWVRGNPYLKKLGKLDMSFKAIVGATVAFFALVLLFTGVVPGLF
jgi:hypothetical protein